MLLLTLSLTKNTTDTRDVVYVKPTADELQFLKTDRKETFLYATAHSSHSSHSSHSRKSSNNSRRMRKDNQGFGDDCCIQ